MARVYVFADEAGNFDFRTRGGASKYFILGSVTLASTDVGARLITLRRELAWKGLGLESSFHASEDAQAVRDEVFKVLVHEDFRFDCTILEKRKTKPYLQDETAFYKIAWYLHFKYVAPKILSPGDELLVLAASLGTKKRFKTMRSAVEDVVWQFALHRTVSHRVAFWPADSDPCLQAVDYCTWAVQRKYERSDTRSYDLIRGKIRSEFPAFAPGRTHYY